MELHNKGIKVTCLTRHFWFGVSWIWWVHRGAPYPRR